MFTCIQFFFAQSVSIMCVLVIFPKNVCQVRGSFCERSEEYDVKTRVL